MRLFDNAAIRIELFPKRKRKNGQGKREKPDQFESSEFGKSKSMDERRHENEAVIEQPSTSSFPFSPKNDRQIYEQQTDTPTSPLSPTSPFSPISQDSDGYEPSETSKSPQKTAPNTFLAIQRAREEAARNQKMPYSPVTGNRMAPSVERLAPHSAASIGKLYLPQKSPNTHNKISENMAAALLGKKSREELRRPSIDQLSIKKSRDGLNKKSSGSTMSAKNSKDALPRKDSMRQLKTEVVDETRSQPLSPNSSPPKVSATTQTSPSDISKPLPAPPSQGKRSLDTIRGPQLDAPHVTAIVSNTTANSTIAKRRYSVGASVEKSAKANSRVVFSQTSSKTAQSDPKPQQKGHSQPKSSSQQNKAAPQPYNPGARKVGHTGFSMQRSERSRNVPKPTPIHEERDDWEQKTTPSIMNRSKNDYRRANGGVYRGQVAA